MRDQDAVLKALDGVDKVVHLAAEVGVGQSMYAIDRYVSVNDHGTAVLLQALTERPVARIVVASSMSIYGEGLYRSGDGTLVEDAVRPVQRHRAGWDPVDAAGTPLIPVATPEWKRPNLASVYAITKFVQERLTLTVAPTYGMEAVALRLFNVYGPGQALSNPYTGVLAIFASRLLNGERPLVFEDGAQRRDFVHVHDVARAFLLALDHGEAPGRVFNIGSGHNVTVAEIAEAVAHAMGRPHYCPNWSARRARATSDTTSRTLRSRGARWALCRAAISMTASVNSPRVARRRAVDMVADARRELEMRGLVA